MAGGLLVAAIGFFAVTRVAGLGVEAVIIASTIYSLGLSPVFTLGIDAIIAAAPAERAGAAAALSETSSELGGALGIALLGSVASAIYRGSLGHVMLPDVPPDARMAALDTLGAAAGAAARLPPEGGGAVLLDAARAAFTHGMQTALTVCAIVSVALSVFVAVALRRARGRPGTSRVGSRRVSKDVPTDVPPIFGC
jgi:DHA2 family multidrug resistance protein-like MFS transporter